jgi:hypothetical protein
MRTSPFVQVVTVVRRVVAVAVVLLAAGCGDEGSGNVEAFCATARRFAVDNPSAAFAAVNPADPAATARALRDAASALGPWADEAPSDVRADIERLRDAAADLAEAFDGSASDAAALAALEQEQTEVEAASARLVAAVRTTCEVDLDAPPTSTG